MDGAGSVDDSTWLWNNGIGFTYSNKTDKDVTYEGHVGENHVAFFIFLISVLSYQRILWGDIDFWNIYSQLTYTLDFKLL